MRVRYGLAAGLSVLAAMTALAALAASLSLPGGSSTELASAGGKPAPKHALTQADKTRLYRAMMMQTFTSPEEARQIAGKLGVPDSEVPVQQLQHSSPSHHAHEEPMTPLEEKAAAAKRSHSYTLHGLNVPYFSRALHYVPPEGGSGMHAASAAYRRQLARQGIVDDNGHYLSAQQDKALAQELQGAIDSYADDELADPTAPPSEGAPLSAQDDRALAEQLNDGMAYAFLPNYGRAPPPPPKVLAGKARQELVRELVAGEKAALIGDSAPPPPRYVDEPHAQQLVEALESAQRYADLPNFGRPPARKARTSAGEVRREQRLVRDLTQGESYADVGAAGGGAQHAVRAAWGVPERRHAEPLTLPQDRNLAKYLHEGIREVFGSRTPPTPKVMSRAEGAALVRGAEQGALAEYEATAPRGPHFQTPQQALALSRSLASTLKSYNSGQGAYVAEYLHTVRSGDKTDAPAAWEPVRGSEGVLREGRAHEDARGARFAAQERVLSQGLKFQRDAQRDNEAAKAAKGKKGWLNVAQGQALAKFLSPQAAILPGQAPGLGYAV